MKRLRFRLSTLLLLTGCIAAGLAIQIRRNDWYVSKAIPSGFQSDCRLAAIEEQDLLVCLKTSRPKRLSVRRLSTGELLNEFDANSLRIAYLQAGRQSQLYGFNWHRLVRIDPTTGEGTELMTTPSAAPESETIVAVAPNGRAVLLAACELMDSGRKHPSATVAYRVRDVASGELIWELPTKDTTNSMGCFSADGQRIGISIGRGPSRFQVWDFVNHRQIDDAPLNLNTMLPPSLFPDGRRVYGSYRIWDLSSGVAVSRLDFGSHYAAIVNDSFLVASYDDELRFWRRRRAEGSWSPLSFPEAWIACVLVVALISDVVRQMRRQQT